MSEHDDAIDPRLAELLADSATWAEAPAEAPLLRTDDPPPAVLEAMFQEPAAEPPAPPPADPAGNVVALDARRRRLPMLAAAAAVVLVLVGAAVAFRPSGDDDGPAGAEVALGAPGGGTATAVADVLDTPAGQRIVLDVDGLGPAPEGSVYQLWVSGPDGRVSAGTFHLRGGEPPIELWAGVSSEEYPRLAVTVEDLATGEEELVLDSTVS